MTAAQAREAISAIFEPNMRRCLVQVNEFVYPDLAVKWIRDIPKDGVLFVVLVPCAADLGKNLMVAFDYEAAWGFRHEVRDY